MLTSISICNYAIISQLNINFGNGFSAITGETGAGKSIIMGALALVLGQRADSKTIKTGEQKCTVEAEFVLKDYGFKSFFEQNDLDYDDNTIIRREVLINGKSRAFINDTPVTLSQIKILGEKLIDIHSQHANLLLKEDSFQLKVVDTIADDEDLKEEYFNHYKKYRNLISKLKIVKDGNAKVEADMDYLKFQYEELNRASFKENEQQIIEEEQGQLSHSEEIKTNMSEAEDLLLNDQIGVIVRLKESITAMKKIEQFSDKIKNDVDRLDSCLIELKDLAENIETQNERIYYDPQRLEEVNNRLDLIYTLQRKHNVNDIASLIKLKDDLESKLSAYNNSGENERIINESIKIEKDEIDRIASLLTKKRKIAANKISLDMQSQLKDLGMADVRFEVSVKPLDMISINGADQIDFMFSANKKSDLLSVADIASGGEIARVMLSIKSLIADSKALPTIIFDEIDTGISGDIADKMANIMKRMSKNIQVICITHLPQIAAKADYQYKVYKTQDNGTNILPLSQGEEREREIAQMLSGSKITDAALENAKALLYS